MYSNRHYSNENEEETELKEQINISLSPSSKNPKSIKSHRKSSQRRRTKKIILTDEELKKLDTMVDVISDEENVNEKTSQIFRNQKEMSQIPTILKIDKKPQMSSLNQLKRLSTLMKIEIIQEIPEELHEINPPIPNGMNQIDQLIKGIDNMRNYIPFDKNEFEFIFECFTHHITLNDENEYISSMNRIHIHPDRNYVSKTNKNIIPMTYEVLLFILIYYLKTKNTFENLFTNLNLTYFCCIDEKTSSKKSYVHRILYKSITTFTYPLYCSLVTSRININMNNRIAFSLGRDPLFSLIVPNLQYSYFLVDGKNQNCPNKKIIVNDKKILDKRYYNYKTKHSGMKSVTIIDYFGLANITSEGFEAGRHDSIIYDTIIDDLKLIEGLNYVIGDTGFIGKKHCLTPYPHVSSLKGDIKYVSSSFVELIIKGSLENGLNTDYVVMKTNSILYGSIITKNDNNIFKGTISGEVELSKFYNDSCTNNAKTHFELACNGTIQIIDDDNYKLSDAECKGILYTVMKQYKFHGLVNTDGLILNGGTIHAELLKLYNSTLSSVRILVENYFGRMNVLFKCSSQSFSLKLDQFGNCNKLMCALTNAHVYFHPMRKFPFYLFYNTLYTNNTDAKKRIDKIHSIQIPETARKILNKYCCCTRSNKVSDIISINKSPGRPVEKDCSITVPNMEVVACNNDEVKMNEETKDNNIQINDLEFVNKMNEKMYTKCLTNDKEKIFNVYSGEEKDISDVITLSALQMNEIKRRIKQTDNKTTEKEFNEMENNKYLMKIQDESEEVEEYVDEEVDDYKENIKMNSEHHDDLIDVDTYSMENEFDTDEIPWEMIPSYMNTDSNKRLNTTLLDNSSFREAFSKLITAHEKVDSSIIELWTENNKGDIYEDCNVCDPDFFVRSKETNKEVWKEYFKENTKRMILGKTNQNNVIIPCCNNTHWVLLLWKKNEQIIFVIDSMNSEEKEMIEEYVCYVIKYIHMNLQYDEPSVSFLRVFNQTDDWSCGYRVLFYMSKLITKDYVNNPKLLCNLNEGDFVEFLEQNTIQKEKE